MRATKNTLPNDTRAAVVELLQARLYDAVDLASQSKQAHWNVKGPNFIALHELFDQVHGEVDGHADSLAERLVSLGGQAYGTALEVGAKSSLSEYPLDASAQGAHIEALSSALAQFGQLVRDASDAAGELGDQNTADLFTEVSRDVDKSLWFVEAHSGGKDG